MIIEQTENKCNLNDWLDRARAEMIKKEIDEYLWKIGFTNWIDASRAEVKNNIFNIIDSYYPK